MRKPKFIPVSTSKGWLINVPSNLSSTGTRQRRYFKKKNNAEGFVAQLNVRREIHGTGARLLTPAQESQAAAAFKLLSDADCHQPLAEIVGHHLARIEKAKASKPFLEVFNTFVQSRARRAAYMRSLAAFRTTSAPLHGKIIRDITPNDIETILAGMAPTYRNLRLRELRAVFNYALKKGWVDENPILRMDFATRKVAEPDVCEPHELRTLLETADSIERRLIPLLCLGAFAGIRQHEILRLHWRNIDLVERSIDMAGEQTKKGRRRSADINDTLLAWLQWYIGKYGIQSGPVSAWSGIWSVRVPLRKLHKAAGIPLKPNALRHSFASYHLAEHADIDALVLALGHRGNPTVLWEHYHRAVKKSAAKAFWAIRPAEAAQNIVAIA